MDKVLEIVNDALMPCLPTPEKQGSQEQQLYNCASRRNVTQIMQHLLNKVIQAPEQR